MWRTLPGTRPRLSPPERDPETDCSNTSVERNNFEVIGAENFSKWKLDSSLRKFFQKWRFRIESCANSTGANERQTLADVSRSLRRFRTVRRLREKCSGNSPGFQPTIKHYGPFIKFVSNASHNLQIKCFLSRT